MTARIQYISKFFFFLSFVIFLVSCQSDQATDNLEELELIEKSSIINNSPIQVSLKFNHIENSVDTKNYILSIDNQKTIKLTENNINIDNSKISNEVYNKVNNLINQIDYKNIRRTTSPYAQFFNETEGHYDVNEATGEKMYLFISSAQDKYSIEITDNSGNTTKLSTYEYYNNHKQIKELQELLTDLLIEKI